MPNALSVRILSILALPLVACTAESASDDDNAGGTAGTQQASGGSAGTGGKASSGGGAGAASSGGAGAGNGGSAGNSGGSAGSAGTGGSAGSGGFTPFTPASCESPNHALPGDAPSLTAGVWQNISPAGNGLNFFGDGNLTQGMAIDTCNSATLYACICAVGGSGSYPKGLYRTTNAGSSWTQVHAFDSCVHVRVNPTNPLHLYVGDGVAGGTHGFWVSKDGGETWTMPPAFTAMCEELGITQSCGITDVYDIGVDPTDFNHALVSLHSPFNWGAYELGAGVLETTDGGESWAAHHYPSSGWGQGHSISFLFNPELGLGNSSTWMLGIQDGGGHWRTTDAGANWDKVSEMGIVHGGGQIYYAPSGVLYASGSPHSIKSTDNGASWTTLESSPGSVGFFGDGENLYGGNLGGPMSIRTASIAADNTWSDFGGGSQILASGPFEFAFDAHNGILYSASTNAGVFALKIP